MTFSKALAERASKGVKVKVMLDAVGSSSIGDEILKVLKDGGCHVAWYNPIRITKLRRINNRTHRKSLIIDGRIGFTGGAGIADVWTGNAQDKEHWRDLQVRLEGPAVRPLQTGFSQNWLECTGELVTGPDFYPAAEPAGKFSVQTIMSSPETGASTARVMYVLAMSAARHSIEIANPYFVPDHLAIDLFRDAVKRGVKVRIMVAGKPNETIMARLNSLRLYGALLEAGVELLEYNRTLLHHKTMVVDGLWCTVGTTNFDTRSFSHNEENNVCVCDAGIAREMNEMFNARRGVLRADQPRGVAVPPALRQGPAGDVVDRAGPGLDRLSPKKLQKSSCALPTIERWSFHVLASSRLERVRSSLKWLVNVAASSASATATVNSSFTSNDRLPKLAEPIRLKTPSMINALTCIIVGWYSAISKPASSRS